MHSSLKWATALPFLFAGSVTHAQSLSEALDASAYFVESDSPAWTSQSDTVYPGLGGNTSAAKASEILNNQQTIMSTFVSSGSNGVVRFHWKVSSEQNFDRLIFSAFNLDTNQIESQISTSGITNWTQRTVNLNSGEYQLTWAFVKDESFSVGEDTAWVDNLQLTNIQPGGSVVDNDSDGVFSLDDLDDDNQFICRDIDSDGCDDCSVAGQATPSNDGTDTDSDGFCDIGDPDLDGDGFNNGVDNCPDDPNPGQEDEDSNGVGDACQAPDTSFLPAIYMILDDDTNP